MPPYPPLRKHLTLKTEEDIAEVRNLFHFWHLVDGFFCLLEHFWILADFWKLVLQFFVWFQLSADFWYSVFVFVTEFFGKNLKENLPKINQ